MAVIMCRHQLQTRKRLQILFTCFDHIPFVWSDFRLIYASVGHAFIPPLYSPPVFPMPPRVRRPSLFNNRGSWADVARLWLGNRQSCAAVSRTQIYWIWVTSVDSGGSFRDVPRLPRAESYIRELPIPKHCCGWKFKGRLNLSFPK